MSITPAPISPWRLGSRILLILVLVNVFAARAGQIRVALYVDLFTIGWVALLFLAARLWPEKIRFTRRTPDER